LAITGEAGSGKSFTFRHFADFNRNVHLVTCADYWNKRQFLTELMIAMGRDYAGMSINEMMYEVVRILKTTENPLVILDEADKLNDAVLYFFITMYNQLEDECGIILAATNHLDKRLRRGLLFNKKGYQEIWSRLGRKCINLKGVSAADIAAICEANGITDRKEIDKVINDSDSDLRRVRRKVHAIKKANQPVKTDWRDE
jgi:DNA transposition AAA+ family ATPase